MQNSGERHIQASKTVRETVSQDGAVLLDIEQGLCFGMNPVGARIWVLIKEGHSEEEAADILAREFQIPQSQVLEDVTLFVKQLEEKRLVHRGNGDHAKKGLLTTLFKARHAS